MVTISEETRKKLASKHTELLKTYNFNIPFEKGRIEIYEFYFSIKKIDEPNLSYENYVEFGHTFEDSLFIE